MQHAVHTSLTRPAGRTGAGAAPRPSPAHAQPASARRPTSQIAAFNFEAPAFKLPNLGAAFNVGAPAKAPAGRGAGGSRQDANTVFVAGATGRLGLRIVRQLLRSDGGLRIRAGARDPASAAQGLAASVRAGLLSPAEASRVTVVPADLTDGPDAIRAAIGPAGVVVQAIGASETSADLSAPKRIDGDASIALVQAAKAAGVGFFVMVTSLGTGKLGWPASALNLFGGILSQKRRAEAELERSGVPYLIVRPGGLERPGDDHGATHAVVFKPRDSTFGGTLSRLQVADVVAAAVADPTSAENKCVELVSEATAPRTPLADLLAAAPQDESQATRLARLERDAAGAAAREAAAGVLEAAVAAAADARAVAAAAADKAKAAKAALAAARAEAGPALTAAEAAQDRLDGAAEAVEEARAREGAAKAVLAAAQAAARKGAVLTPDDVRAIQLPFLDPEGARREAEAKAEAARRAEAERASAAAAKAAAAKAQAEEVARATAARRAEEEAAAAAVAAASAKKAEEERAAAAAAAAAAKAEEKEQAAAAAAAAKKAEKETAAAAAAAAAKKAEEEKAAAAAAAAAKKAEEEKAAATAAAAAKKAEEVKAAAAAAAAAAAKKAEEEKAAAAAALAAAEAKQAAAPAPARAPTPATPATDARQAAIDAAVAAAVAKVGGSAADAKPAAATATPSKGAATNPRAAEARAWIQAWRAKNRVKEGVKAE